VPLLLLLLLLLFGGGAVCSVPSLGYVWHNSHHRRRMHTPSVLIGRRVVCDCWVELLAYYLAVGCRLIMPLPPRPRQAPGVTPWLPGASRPIELEQRPVYAGASGGHIMPGDGRACSWSRLTCIRPNRTFFLGCGRVGLCLQRGTWRRVTHPPPLLLVR